MTEYQSPSIATHVPVTGTLPDENLGALTGRADLPTPNLWQGKVKVVHRVTGKSAIVVRIDYGMMMFRAYFPDEVGSNGEQGRFSERTEWYQCRDWDVEVTYSPAELERQAARQLFEDEIQKLDGRQLATAKLLCDDADPNKALAKFRLLIDSGMLSLPESAAPIVLPPEPVQRVRKSANEQAARAQAQSAARERAKPTGGEE